MSDNLPIKGHIYLLKLCDTKHRIIYKPGKSVNFYKRYKEYNYAKILTFIVSDDITKDENEIISLFNINCKLDTGREFFLAKDDNFVLKIFMDYFSNKINRSIETSNSNNVNSVSNLVVEPIVVEPVVTEPVVSEPIVIEPVVSEPIVIEPVVESSNTIESIENNKILERTCPTCKKEFNFASRLKAHLESTIHCKKTDAEITIFFKKFEKISNFNCDICNHKYTKLQNLKRHIENSTCKTFIEQNKLLNELETIKLKISNLSINN
jgi:hypothetical protein